MSSDTLGALCGMFVFGTVAVLCFPASFLLLPVSRRRAKVRWSHIGRVGTYSLFIPIVCGAGCLSLLLLAIIVPSWTISTINGALGTAVAGMPLLLVCWWWTAIKHYLKIPHALAIAFLLAVMLSLLVPVFLVVVGTLIGVL